MKRLSGRGAIIGLLLITAIMLLPIGWAASVSLRKPSAVFTPTLIPKPVTLSSYTSILSNMKYLIWLRNSLLVSSISTLAALILGSIAAYGLSRFKLRASSPIQFYFLSTKMVPPLLLSISYLVIINRIGIYDTLAAVIIMDTASILPFTIWLMKAFLDTIPFELDQAAMIDGCSRVSLIFRVLLPNSLTQLIATGTYCFLLTWNEYLFALVFTGSEKKMVFTLGITSFIGQWWTNYPSLMAGAIIAISPIVIAFLALQRYIINSVATAFK